MNLFLHLDRPEMDVLRNVTRPQQLKLSHLQVLCSVPDALKLEPCFAPPFSFVNDHDYHAQYAGEQNLAPCNSTHRRRSGLVLLLGGAHHRRGECAKGRAHDCVRALNVWGML